MRPVPNTVGQCSQSHHQEQGARQLLTTAVSSGILYPPSCSPLEGQYRNNPQHDWTGEVAHWLRALTAEGLNSVLSLRTISVAHNSCNFSVRGIQCWPRYTHVHACTPHTHIHTLKNKNTFPLVQCSMTSLCFVTHQGEK